MIRRCPARSRTSVLLIAALVGQTFALAPAAAGSTTAGADRSALAAGREPIRLFPEAGAPDERGAEELANLTRQPGMLLLQAARFDPVVQGQPDFSGTFPSDETTKDVVRASNGGRDPIAYIVQFDGPVTEAAREAVEQNGASLYFYLPNNAYLARMLPTEAFRVSRLPGVRWVGRYQPGYKITRPLARFTLNLDPQSAASEWFLPDGTPKPLNVTLFPGSDLDAVSLRLEQAGFNVLAAADDPEQPMIVVAPPVGNFLTTALTRAANIEAVVAILRDDLHTLRNDDAVWIHQSYNTTANRTYNTSATIWNHDLLGEGEVFVITDSGVDRDMCFFRSTSGPLVATQQVSADGQDAGALSVDNSQRKIVAYNVLKSFRGTPSPNDDPTSFHGSHMAGTITGDNLANVAQEDGTVNASNAHHNTDDGIAPQAKFIVQDIGDSGGNLVGIPPIVDTMWQQAYNAGARISSNSWGGGSNVYNVTAQLADRMTHRNESFLTVLPAGNAGNAAASPGSVDAQANSKNALIAGGNMSQQTSPWGNNRWSGSGVGRTADGRLKPDVMGSTATITSALGNATTGDNNCSTQSFTTGTSSATASSAGSAILAREYYRKGYYPGGAKKPADGFDPSAALLKATLINGGRNMDGTNIPSAANADAPSGVQGWGRVTLDDALWFSDEDGSVSANTRKLAAWDIRHAQGLATGETWESEVFVAGTTLPLKIHLVWSDPPALLNVDPVLVNDLDLVVIAPDGREYHGNQWYAEDTNKSTIEDSKENVTTFDTLDNVEGIYLETDSEGTFPSGLYKVRVVGRNVPGSPLFGKGRQGFAVVATGDLNRNAGRVTIVQRQIGCEGVVNVNLFDTNSSGNVTLTTSGGDSETIVMTGTSPNFSGSISAFWNEPIQTGDGRLQVIQNETITATYNDSSPGGHTSQSTARVLCVPTIGVSSHAFSGGCDGDGFLDDGEFADLTVTLLNNGPTTLTGVTGKLSSLTNGVYVAQPDTKTFPSLAPGATASNASPFKVSAKGVAALQTGSLRLEIHADGRMGRPIFLDFTTTLEADKKITPGMYKETFEDDDQDGTVEASDSDGTVTAVKCNHDPTLDTDIDWFWLDLDGTCEATNPRWGERTCDGSRGVMFPITGATCTSRDNSTNPLGYSIRSNVFFTGNAGSVTRFKNFQVRERYDFASYDGACDFSLGVFFRLVDPADFLFTNLVHSSSKTKTDSAITDLDLTEDYSFAVLDNSDMFALLIEFIIIQDGAFVGTTTCPTFFTGGHQSNWRIDDVVLTWENEEIIADATTCADACVSPPPPAAPAAAAAATASNRTTVTWNAVSGADHYDVYRGDGTCGGLTRVGRVAAPATGFSDTLETTSNVGYRVRAVNANGLCESADSNCAAVTPAGSCRQAPGAPTNLVAANAALSACQMNLTWNAPASNPCGNTLNYRIYRSTDPNFTPQPGNLLTTVSGTSYNDTALASGFDSSGEPTGTAYHYVVRTIDTVTGVEEGNTNRSEGRAGGPQDNGTWLDDAGDTRLVKMTSQILCDFNGSEPGWSVSRLHDSDGTLSDGSTRSYRSVKAEFANNSLTDTDPLTCTALVSPQITLSSSPTPSLRFFRRYNIEDKWDGVVVEVSNNGGATWSPLNTCPYPSNFSATVSGGCDTDADGTGNCPNPPGGSFDCDGDGTGSCIGEGDTYINSCDYPPGQGAYNGPAGNSALTPWVQDTCSLSDFAGQTVRFRFNLSTDCGSDFDGMYVDRIEVLNAQIESACTAGACATPPVFPGVVSALDQDPVLDTGVRLTWPSVSNWGGGGTGTFEVYRNGAAIQTGIAAGTTFFVDNTATNNVLHAYRVTAKGGGSCNIRDGNDVLLRAADCAEPTPSAVDTATLTLVRGSANVEITSTDVADAGEYRFYHSGDRTNVFGAGTYVNVPGPRGSHGVLSDGLNWYYLLKVTDGPVCGNTEVP